MSKKILVKELDKNIPFGKVTKKMLKSMENGQDIELDNNFTISKHSEENMIDIFHTETWTNLYSVTWDYRHKYDLISFEKVDHDKEEVF